MSIHKVNIEISDLPGKKLKAIFYDKQYNKIKTTHFGSAGMSDYTQHKNKQRKNLYILRHEKREDWNDPTTPGALSRWILWEIPNLKKAIANFKKRFNLN